MNQSGQSDGIDHVRGHRLRLCSLAKGHVLHGNPKGAASGSTAWLGDHAIANSERSAEAQTIARRKSPCAGRSSALNRRNRSHISREYLEQPAIHEPVQKFQYVRA